MSTQAPKANVAKSNLTAKQRDWLKKLGAVVNASGDGADADTNEETSAPVLKDAAQTLVPVAAGPFVPLLLQWGPEVLDVIKKLGGGRRIAAVQVVNNTDRVIHRGNPTFKGGAFKKLPPLSIKPGDKGEFVAASPEPIPVLGVLKEGCIGKLPWLLDGD